MDMSSYPPGEPTPQQTSYIPPPAPPHPQKKGFNWLACCGISCLVVVVLGAVFFWGCYRMVQPFVGMGMEMGKLQQEVTAADAVTIRSAATPVTAQTLAQSATPFEDQWVAVEGVIVGEDFGGSAFESGEFNTEDTTQYVLENNIIVMDVSKAPRVGVAGDTLRAYGKIYAWDMAEMGKMPFVGKFIAEEMQKDPELAGNTQLVFVIAKEVEIVAGGTTPAEPSADAPVEESSGWVD